MAKVGDVGTLKELGVVVGDVVEYVSGSPTHDYRLGDRYTCTIKDGELIVRYERGWFNSVEEDSWLYRIISRANPKPKLWRDMTPEEKGALLLAAHEGSQLQYIHNRDWTNCNEVFSEFHAYRIKPHPKIETVTLHGRPDVQWVLERCKYDTHRITFQTIDGKPDCASIKMEEL